MVSGPVQTHHAALLTLLHTALNNSNSNPNPNTDLWPIEMENLCLDVCPEKRSHIFCIFTLELGAHIGKQTDRRIDKVTGDSHIAAY